MFRSRRTASDDPPERPEIGDDMLVIVDRGLDPYLVLFHEPGGFRAEQFRALRNQLMAMNPDGEPKSLVIASAIMGEGKSIVATNLAMAFAELERHKVLLVDGDMRAPSIERMLNLNAHDGLSDVLLDRVPLSRAIRHTGFRQLSVLGAGSRLAGPSELLTTLRVDEMFARLKEDYQYVIIDTPPVLPATDAGVLAARADGTLVTVRLEHSPKGPTKDAIRNLQDLGANVLGVFVTEVRGSNIEKERYFGRTQQEF